MNRCVRRWLAGVIWSTNLLAIADSPSKPDRTQKAYFEAATAGQRAVPAGNTVEDLWAALVLSGVGQ